MCPRMQQGAMKSLPQFLQEPLILLMEGATPQCCGGPSNRWGEALTFPNLQKHFVAVTEMGKRPKEFLIVTEPVHLYLIMTAYSLFAMTDEPGTLQIQKRMYFLVAFYIEYF